MNAAHRTGSLPRSQIGNNASTGALQDVYTRGMERYLEVRMAAIPQIEVGIASINASGDLKITTDAAHGLALGEVIHISGTTTAPAVLNGVTGLYLENNFWIVADPNPDGTSPAANSVTLEIAAYKASTTEVTVSSGGSATVSSGKITRYGNPNNVVVGYGGNFVYLIGKKHLRG